MTVARFVLSAFGDEVAADLEAQLTALAADGVYHLELRSAWGRNVLDLTAADLGRAARLLRERGFGVSAVGSPVGKSGLDRGPEYELERLDRALEAAEILGTTLVRVFSFHVPAGKAGRHREPVLERLTGLAALAGDAGKILLLENEKGVYADTPERCLDVLEAVASPALRLALDPANLVQVGVRPLEQAWPLLAPHVAHVHVKDARLADGTVVPAGEGDSGWPGLLAALAGRGYQGFLTLEPHLAMAGTAGGFSGPDGWHRAVAALRRLLDGSPAEVA